MKLKDIVQRRTGVRPPRVLIYGPEGIGKTTWACSAPSPIVLATEDGLGTIDVPHVRIDSWLQLTETVDLLASEQHDYRTVVLDSLDWAERLCWASLCEREGVASIERVGGGYRRGYRQAAEEQDALRRQLDSLVDRGIGVILVAHAESETVHDPTTVSYTRWQPRLDRYALEVWTEWCDVIGYATHAMTVRREPVAFGERALAVSLGGRVLRLVGEPSFVAKNRYGLPAELPLDWAAFAAEFGKVVRREKQ